jgi:hypothetical protein
MFRHVGEILSKIFSVKKMTHIESYLRESARNSRNLALVSSRIRKIGGCNRGSKIFGDTN